MIRPIFSLWRYYWTLLTVILSAIYWVPVLILILPLRRLGVRLELPRLRWVLRFSRHVRRFRTIGSKEITLHYAAELADEWDFQLMLPRCRQEFLRVAERFPEQCLSGAVVYLFAKCEQIGEIFGGHFGGIALSPNIIAIAYDNYLEESLRHEFAHLFSFSWNAKAPPILSEGLAGWMQGTKWAQPIDVAARQNLCDPRIKLSLLADRKFFFSEPQRISCYVLAGSFTGFLIRRYGWQQYQKLFVESSGEDFEAAFENRFATKLQDAESQWRKELVVTEALIRKVKKSYP